MTVGPSGEGRRIQVVRSGGIAGMAHRASVDLGDLDPHEAAEIEQLMARHVGSAPASAGSDRPGRGVDRFCYEVSITTDEGHHSATLREEELPAETRRLLDQLLSGRPAGGQ